MPQPQGYHEGRPFEKIFVCRETQHMEQTCELSFDDVSCAVQTLPVAGWGYHAGADELSAELSPAGSYHTFRALGILPRYI